MLLEQTGVGARQLCSMACNYMYTGLLTGVHMPLLLVPAQACFQHTFRTEFLAEDEGYRCPSCKKQQAATKQLQLFACPRVLFVVLKRFATRGGSSDGSEEYSSSKVCTGCSTGP